MFRIGDYVAHYKEGVCEVVNIGKIDMGSSDKEYYTLNRYMMQPERYIHRLTTRGSRSDS